MIPKRKRVEAAKKGWKKRASDEKKDVSNASTKCRKL